jgi:hypothetical protein
MKDGRKNNNNKIKEINIKAKVDAHVRTHDGRSLCSIPRDIRWSNCDINGTWIVNAGIHGRMKVC